jgi:tetratricopeptide (TPR) repeat protein
MDQFLDRLLDEETLVHPIIYWVVLLVLVAGCLGVELALSSLIPLIWLRVIIYVLVSAGWTAFWVSKWRALPKNESEGIGIIISVVTDDKTGGSRLSDFVTAFRKQISDSNLDNFVQVIQAKNYQAKRLIPLLEVEASAQRLNNDNPERKSRKSWIKINQKIRGHLFIHGRLTERELGTKYVLDFDAFFEPGFSEELKTQLFQDYNLLWTKKMLIEVSNEISGFVDGAQHYYLTAKYILGFLALYQGNPDAALLLHSSLKSDLQILKIAQDTSALVQRVDKQLSVDNFAVAFKKVALGQLDQAEIFLALALNLDNTNADAYMLAALVLFRLKRDCAGALRMVYKAKEYGNPNVFAWRYSEAFLFLYTERYDAAVDTYRQIVDTSYEGEEYTIQQVVAFQANLVTEEPSFISAYYVLGLIAYKKQGNIPMAHDLFGRFLKAAGKNRKYKLLKASAKRYKRELDSMMSLREK